MLGKGGVRVLNEAGRPEILITCDHARAGVPAQYRNLGLPPAEFGRHIAYDIGAAWLAETLSERLQAPAFFSGYSRLLIDCNRQPDAQSFVPAISDGTTIPANVDIDAAERAARKRAYFDPYHATIAAGLKRALAVNVVPVVLSIHSFTPIADGRDRSKALGVLWDEDRRLVDLMLPTLRDVMDLPVGENVPYPGFEPEGYGLRVYNREWGLPFILFEARQDILSDCRLRLQIADAIEKAVSVALQTGIELRLQPH